MTGGTAWPPGDRGLTEVSVNTSTADGLKEALTDVRVVIDLSNSPPFDSRRRWKFFETSHRVLTISAPDLGDVTVKMLMGIVWSPRSHTRPNGCVCIMRASLLARGIA